MESYDADTNKKTQFVIIFLKEVSTRTFHLQDFPQDDSTSSKLTQVVPDFRTVLRATRRRWFITRAPGPDVKTLAIVRQEGKDRLNYYSEGFSGN
ncbi:hypothetical protein E2C01_037253 [Portunus trituberculatus]|uniref:Uncharacterized protein n=1 Tax=Portunus trituberculatus TaxID=210409 RepID=A0A5B7FEU0_PORTR|nr:hypothetical protein [Portunus trituberculatus]